MRTRLNLKVILFIVIISVVTALVYNYLNEEGLRLIEMPGTEEVTNSSTTGTIEFYQPVTIDAESAHLLFTKGVKFIDIRSSSEYKSGHISDAINLPSDYIEDAGSILESYQKETPFVIYGDQSDSQNIKATAEVIFNLQYKRLYVFPGGVDEWLQKNYEVVR